MDFHRFLWTETYPPGKYIRYPVSVSPGRHFWVDGFPLPNMGYDLQVDELFQALAGVKAHFIGVFWNSYSPFARENGGEKMNERIPDKQWKSLACFGLKYPFVWFAFSPLQQFPVNQPDKWKVTVGCFWVSNEGDDFKTPDIFRLFMKELLLVMLKNHQSCNAHIRWLNELYNYVIWYHLGLVFWMSLEAVKSFACIQLIQQNIVRKCLVKDLQFVHWCLKGEEA